MATKASRYAQSFFGDEGGGLTGLPGASILVRVQGTSTPASLWADRVKATALSNPLPTGVPYGSPGLDIDGNAVFYADPGDATAGSTVYEAMVTVGGTTVGPIPVGTIPPDMADVGDPAAIIAEAATRSAAVATLTAGLAGKQATIPSATYAVRPEVQNPLADDAILKYAPAPATAANPTVSNVNDWHIPIHVDRNGRSWWRRFDKLKYSDDDGATFTDVTPPSNSAPWFPRSIYILRDLANGEYLLGSYGVPGGTKSRLYRSTNANGALTSATTWTMVLESTSGGANFIPRTISVVGSMVFVTEYGAVTVAADAPRRAWLSQDYGLTFTQVFDLADYQNVDNVAHVHGCAIDRFTGRLYVSHGDNPAQGVYYSDDLGRTWQYIVGYQPTFVVAVKAGVLLGNDWRPNGVRRIPRLANTQPVASEQSYTVDAAIGSDVFQSHIGIEAYRRSGRDQATYMSMQPANTATARPSLLLATFDGVSVFEIWRDAVNTINSGLTNIMGPTATGKILGLLTDNRSGLGMGSILKCDAPAWGATTDATVADGSITAVKVAADAITTVKLADSSVTTAKLTDTSVSTAKLIDGSVTAAKVADGSLSTTKLSFDVATQAELDAVAAKVSRAVPVAQQLLSNSAAEMSLTGGGISIAAAGLQVRSVLRLRASGQMDNIATSGTIVWRLKLGSVVLGSYTMTSLAGALTSQTWWLDATINVRTIGASGQARGALFSYLSANGFTRIGVTTSPGAIDMTGVLVADLTAQWATADPGNVIRTEVAVVELIQP